MAIVKHVSGVRGCDLAATVEGAASLPRAAICRGTSHFRDVRPRKLFDLARRRRPRVTLRATLLYFCDCVRRCEIVTSAE